jgi:MFS family permease
MLRGRAKQSLGAGFWTLWGASSLSGLGDGIVLVALPLLAVGITRSPVVVAGLVVANGAAQGVAAIPAGVLADRVSKRRMLLGVGTVQFLLFSFLALLVLKGADPIWVLYALAAATGAAYSCYTAASNSVLVDLVPENKLESANGWITGGQTVSEQLAGQGVGGFLLAVGRSIPFLSDAVSFAAAWVLTAATLRSVRTNPAAPEGVSGSRPSFAADMKAGLRYFWSHPLLRPIALSLGALGFAQAMVLDVLVLYATGPLGLTKTAYGPLLASMSVVNLVGAMSASRLNRRAGTGTIFAVGAVLCVVGYGIIASTAQLWAALVGLGLDALAVPIINITILSYRQRIIPAEMRGRALMGHRTTTIIWVAAGGLAGGLVASAWSLRASFLAACAVDVIATVTLVIPLARRLNARAVPGHRP